MANVVYSTNFKTVRMKCSGTATAGYFVKVGTDGVENATDGTMAFGIAMESGTDGAYIGVAIGPVIIQTDLAGTFDPDVGDAVYIASGTTVDGGASTNISCGYVVDADPAAGAATAKVLFLGPEQITHA